MFIDLKKDIDNLRTATESSCYGPQDYSTVGASSFYTVLDNTYDANWVVLWIAIQVRILVETFAVKELDSFYECSLS